MQPVNMPPDQRRPGDPGYTPTVSANRRRVPDRRPQASFDADRFYADLRPGFRFRFRFGLYAVCGTTAKWNLGFLAAAIRLREQPAEERLQLDPAAPKRLEARINPTLWTNRSKGSLWPVASSQEPQPAIPLTPLFFVKCLILGEFLKPSRS